MCPPRTRPACQAARPPPLAPPPPPSLPPRLAAQEGAVASAAAAAEVWRATGEWKRAVICSACCQPRVLRTSTHPLLSSPQKKQFLMRCVDPFLGTVHALPGASAGPYLSSGFYAYLLWNGNLVFQLEVPCGTFIKYGDRGQLHNSMWL